MFAVPYLSFHIPTPPPHHEVANSSGSPSTLPRVTSKRTISRTRSAVRPSAFAIEEKKTGFCFFFLCSTDLELSCGGSHRSHCDTGLCLFFFLYPSEQRLSHFWRCNCSVRPIPIRKEYRATTCRLPFSLFNGRTQVVYPRLIMTNCDRMR